MLDKRSKKLLDVLLKKCGEDGAYKILEIEDIQRAVRLKMDSEGLDHAMKFLAVQEMIDVKYNDEKVYCIAILPKGRLYEETRVNEKRGSKMSRLVVLVIVASAFVGAFLGTALANIIF